MNNVAVDVGNSRIKVGIFNSFTLVQTHTLTEIDDLYSILVQPHDHLIVSSVKGSSQEILERAVSTGNRMELRNQMPLPIKVHYATPHTLGVDRIADACGAIEIFPNEDCLVIDLGTCINYEFVDKHKNYHGGLIAPGLSMRFQSMHNFTARLPLVEAVVNPKLIGTSTVECLQSGAWNGIFAEMNWVIDKMKVSYPTIKVILTGGDHRFFENQLKHSIFAAPELALLGLNRILMHNVNL